MIDGVSEEKIYGAERVIEGREAITKVRYGGRGFLWDKSCKSWQTPLQSLEYAGRCM